MVIQQKQTTRRRAAESRRVTSIRRLWTQILADAAPETRLAAAPSAWLPAISKERMGEQARGAYLSSDLKTP